MKTTLQILLLFFSYYSLAQISLEHTYTNGIVKRVQLEYSGEKYYVFKSSTNELLFYNPDHTLWKTIILSASPQNPLAGGARINHVSESIINPDAKIEILFSYYNNMSNKYESRISQEDGIILLTIPDAFEARITEIKGLPNKLITENIVSNPISKVYSLPDLTQENVYTDGTIKRIKLESSGEKYYLLDKINQNVKIYNSNHSLFKTIALPKPLEAQYGDIGIISENQINTDALLEIGYSYYTLEGSTANYVGKLINENNLELLSIPKARILTVNVIEGLDNKLMATLNNATTSIGFSTNVYEIPSLNLESAYSNEVMRVKLENSGEKYHTYSDYSNNQINIYNSNHSLWKTLTLTKPVNAIQVDGSFNVVISESKINSDALLEVIYSYYTGLLGFGYEVSSRIVNEQGEILLEAEFVQGLYLNEITDLSNKIMGHTYSSPYPSVISFVYSLKNLSISDYIKNTRVVVAPNPAKSFLNINSSASPIKEATIYNLTGALVKRETAQNISKIDVDKLPAGIYILNLTDFNNQKSTHKITILH